jgi:hypothetical protein
MKTVTDALQPLTSHDAATDNTVTRWPAVTSCPPEAGCPYCLDREDSWPARRLHDAHSSATMTTRTGSARTGRTARGSRARSSAKAMKWAIRSATRTGQPPGTPLALLLLSPPLVRSTSGRGTVAVAVLIFLAVAALFAVIRPTRNCPARHGQRVRVTKHWRIGRLRTRPCKRCSTTGC